MDIKFEPSREFEHGLEKAAEALVERVADRTAKQAEDQAPVRTGALKDSISSRVSRDGSVPVGEVVADTEYAAYVEFGTQDTDAQPFLRPALIDVIDRGD